MNLKLSEPVNKMKLFLLLFSLICTHLYAACANTPPDINLNIGSMITIPNLPNSNLLSLTTSNQVLGGCNPNVYLRSEFTPNTALLSSPSPFALVNSNFTITGGSGDAATINQAKTYLMNNLRFAFTLKDNNIPASAVSIQNNTATHNLVPNTTPNPANIYLYNTIPFYTGASPTGGSASFGIRIPTFSYELSSTKPSSNIVNALQNATITIQLGTLKTGYLNAPASNTTPLTEQLTNVNLSFSLSFSLPTCAVDVPATLDIGSTTIQTLETNSFSNNTPFQLKIICSAAIPNRTFKLTVQDANDLSNINTSGILKTQPGLANPSNVAIRLMNGSSPFSIGSPFNYATTGTSPTQTQFIYTPSAQLFKISSPVTLGNVAGKARFFLDYD